ncbi:hypothetical protein H4R18_001465 [Coemansia javaensis]|uniref:Transcription factor IIIC putative zinc-finger domain-containing protein n=1 Tax=Coemansia javaensis TaxID=2761396 RepID=A0A9W8HH35_9FUNG|nr:hypothetical protein H4R18_001465 [Coemansia javaensis]
MDVKVIRQPLPIGGVHWSTANRWVIATSAQAFIVTPQLAAAGRIPDKHEVVAAIEATQNVEAVGLLDELPGDFPYPNAVAVLASDSTVRLFASARNPDAFNWHEVGRGDFGTGPEHVCAIATATLGALPVVACGSLGGKVSVVGLRGADGCRIDAARVLAFAPAESAVSHLAWVRGGRPGEGGVHVLAVCAADGAVQLWSVAGDLSEATLLETVCGRDWRPVTAHGVGADCAVLAKLGLAIVVDARAPQGVVVDRVPLGASQTLVACAVDGGRDRIYVGSHDFVISVLARRDGRWCRAAEEEAPLRDGMRRTIVQSFTTKFNMKRLFLRGLALSPHGRHLAFVADDQASWDLVIDGEAITRIHFHPLGGWTPDVARGALLRVLAGEYRGDLRYALWDIVNGEAAGAIAAIVESVRATDAPEQSQRLFVLNVASRMLEGDQPAAEARELALGGHARALFGYVAAALRSSTNGAGASDMALRSRQLAGCPNNHLFDVCSVTLKILESPGADQCNMCAAKRVGAAGRRPESLAGRVAGEFPLCIFCRGRFYAAVV